MERHVRILGWLWIVTSISVALISSAGMVVYLLTVGPEQPARDLLFVALGQVPGIIGGRGLRRWRSWSRGLVLVIGIVSLIILPPIGMTLGLYSVWVLSRKETAQLFILHNSSSF